MKTESITVNLFVRDVKESAVFYSGMLGLEPVMQVPENGTPEWMYLMKGNSGIMLQSWKGIPQEILDHMPRGMGAPMLIYVKAKDIMSTYEKARHKECLLKGLETTFYGHTEFTMLDPDGYLVTVAEETGNAK